MKIISPVETRFIASNISPVVVYRASQKTTNHLEAGRNLITTSTGSKGFCEGSARLVAYVGGWSKISTKERKLTTFIVIVHIDDRVRIKECRAIPMGVECYGFIAGRIALKGDPFALATAIGHISREVVSFAGCAGRESGLKVAIRLRALGSALPSRPVVDGYFPEDAYASYQAQDEGPKYLWPPLADSPVE